MSTGPNTTLGYRRQPLKTFDVCQQSQPFAPEVIAISENIRDALNYMVDRAIVIEVCGWEAQNPVPGAAVFRYPEVKPGIIDQMQMWIEYPDWYLDTASIPDWCRAPIGAPQ